MLWHHGLCPGYDIGDFSPCLHPFLHAQIEPAIAEEMITLSLEPAAFIPLRERNLVIQTDNSPRYTDAGKQTRITFPIWPNQRQAFPNQSWDKSFPTHALSR